MFSYFLYNIIASKHIINIYLERLHYRSSYFHLFHSNSSFYHGKLPTDKDNECRVKNQIFFGLKSLRYNYNLFKNFLEYSCIFYNYILKISFAGAT